MQKENRSFTILCVPLSQLPPRKVPGTRLVSLHLHILGSGRGGDHKHPDVQSHKWARVKEVTVLLHGAQHRLDSAVWLPLPTSSSTFQAAHGLLG